MTVNSEFNSDDPDGFFLSIALERLKEVAKPRPDGTFFLKRRDCNLRLAQMFCFDKSETKEVIRIMAARKKVRDANRGLIIYGK